MAKIRENPNIQINTIKSNTENMWYNSGQKEMMKLQRTAHGQETHSQYTTRGILWQ